MYFYTSASALPPQPSTLNPQIYSKYVSFPSIPQRGENGIDHLRSENLANILEYSNFIF